MMLKYAMSTSIQRYDVQLYQRLHCIIETSDFVSVLLFILIAVNIGSKQCHIKVNATSLRRFDVDKTLL